MKALVFAGQGDICLETIDDPAPGAGEVVIRPSVVQVCTTDAVNFEKWPPEWPNELGSPIGRQRGGSWPAVMTEGMVPGHEGGGEIVGIGQGVTEFSVGDRVAVDSTYRCGDCPECHEMRWRDCRTYGALSNRPGVPTYLGINSAQPEKFGRGLMAEYSAVPVNMSYLIPPQVSDLAAVAMEIGGTTLSSVRCSGLQLGDIVVQIGGELYGSLRMQLSRIAGASVIVYVEANARRREWAAALGIADVIIDPAETDPVETIRAMYPNGADLTFASATARGSWALAYSVTRRAGIIVPFDGDPRLYSDFLEGFNPATMTGDGRRWNSFWPPISSAEPLKGGKDRNDHQIFMDLMAQGRIDGADPVTRIASMWGDQADIDRAFTSPWKDEVRTAISTLRAHDQVR